MKPAILYAIRRGRFGDISIMTVTSQKTRRYYGRDENGEATNCAARDVIAQLSTEPAALKLIDEIKIIEKERRARNSEASKAWDIAHAESERIFNNQLKALINGKTAHLLQC